MPRSYAVTEIQAACAALEALGNVNTDEDATDEVSEQVQRTALLAIDIIETGLREIKAEHQRVNERAS